MARVFNLTEKDHVRFWAKVNKTGVGGCWVWTACLRRGGYGAFNVDGTPEIASRVSWFIHNGEIPHGLDVLHTCDNPPCINPDHLFVGTALDNARDAMRKGRIDFSARACRRLTGEDVQIIRKLYVPRKVTFQILASQFTVSSTTIRKVVNGTHYREVQG